MRLKFLRRVPELLSGMLLFLLAGYCQEPSVFGSTLRLQQCKCLLRYYCSFLGNIQYQNSSSSGTRLQYLSLVPELISGVHLFLLNRTSKRKGLWDLMAIQSMKRFVIQSKNLPCERPYSPDKTFIRVLGPICNFYLFQFSKMSKIIIYCYYYCRSRKSCPRKKRGRA